MADPVQKIVKKSTYWWKHGKHKGMLGIYFERNRRIIQLAKLRAARNSVNMFDSVSKLLDVKVGRKH